MSIKPAIVAVGYNRPDSMRRLLQSIVNAHYPFDGIDLIISIDESNRSDDVQKVADEFQWNYGNKIIKRYPERQGLRKHIIQCGDLSNQYGAVIILEDDLMVSPSFYNYTYAAINYYKDNPKIVGASLYSHCWNGYAGLQFIPEKNEYDAYLGQYSISWGQCWAKEQWNLFKEWYLLHEDKLPAENKAMPSTILRWSQQSWGKYFISYMVEKNLYYAVPYAGMTTNFSEMGTHNSSSSATFQVPLQQGNKVEYKLPDFEQAVKYDLFFDCNAAYRKNMHPMWFYVAHPVGDKTVLLPITISYDLNLMWEEYEYLMYELLIPENLISLIQCNLQDIMNLADSSYPPDYFMWNMMKMANLSNLTLENEECNDL